MTHSIPCKALYGRWRRVPGGGGRDDYKDIVRRIGRVHILVEGGGGGLVGRQGGTRRDDRTIDPFSASIGHFKGGTEYLPTLPTTQL